ncbi:g8272 [Coccomyxa elongata]
MWRTRKVAANVVEAGAAFLKQSVRGAKSNVPKPNKDRYTVVLKKDVEGVGQEGDVLRVRHGYARNILIPSKKAVPGTTKNIELYGKRVLSSDIKQAHGVVEVAAEALDREVEAVLKRLAIHPVEIKRAVVSKERDGKVQPTNDLAEAVTSAHVVEAVAKQKRVDLVEQILYMDPIREIGEFDVPLRMTYPDGRAPTFRLKIVATATSA